MFTLSVITVTSCTLYYSRRIILVPIIFASPKKFIIDYLLEWITMLDIAYFRRVQVTPVVRNASELVNLAPNEDNIKKIMRTTSCLIVLIRITQFVHSI